MKHQTMKELRLQINVSFYTLTASLIIFFFAVTLFITSSHNNAFVKLTLLLCFTLFGIVNINLLMALSGKRAVSLCNNGLHYVSAVGQKVYIPLEEITHIKIRKLFATKITEVLTIDCSVYFISFQFSTLQELKLKRSGYLTQ
ncbi:hypothetical protein [Pseudoalteromonas sp. A25]|uniref:hypothetical protein n=1 Tax=Pseudoalteromonas sp. A25 TaxID=116092 RepID=UPI00126139B6|nr:hypothetical protein [Pseudoalteromonas sp. A25]